MSAITIKPIITEEQAEQIRAACEEVGRVAGEAATAFANALAAYYVPRLREVARAAAALEAYLTPPDRTEDQG